MQSLRMDSDVSGGYKAKKSNGQWEKISRHSWHIDEVVAEGAGDVHCAWRSYERCLRRSNGFRFEANRAAPEGVMRFRGLQGAEVVQRRDGVDGLRSHLAEITSFISRVWLVVQTADAIKAHQVQRLWKAGKQIYLTAQDSLDARLMSPICHPARLVPVRPSSRRCACSLTQ